MKAAPPPSSTPDAAERDTAEPGLDVRLLGWLDRWRRVIFVALPLFYLAGFTGQWRPGADSALYLAVARNLARGAGFVEPTGVYPQFNGGLPWMAAGLFRVFGIGHHLPIHVVMFGLAMATLACVYWLFLLHAGRPTAVLMVLLVGVCETFYQYAFYVLNEMPFALGAALALVGYERLCQRRPRVWLSALVLVAGLAVMAAFRSVVVTFVAGLVLAGVVDLLRARRPVALAAGGAVVITLVLLSRLANPHPFFSLSSDERVVVERLAALPGTMSAIVTDRLPDLLTEATAEAVFGFDAGPILAGALSIGVFAATLLLWRWRTLWGMLIVVFVAQWLLVLVVDRYFLPLMPLVLYAWWLGALWVGDRAGRWRDAVIIAALVLVIGGNVAMDGRFVLEQRSRPFIEHFKHGRFAQLATVAEHLRTQSPEDVTVFASSEWHAVLGYWSDRAVVPTRQAWRATQVEQGGAMLVLLPMPDAELDELRAVGFQPGAVVMQAGELELHDLVAAR